MVDPVIILVAQFVLLMMNVAGTIMIQQQCKRNGWIILAVSQLMWVVYAWLTGQFMFVASSTIYFVIFMRGAITQR